MAVDWNVLLGVASTVIALSALGLAIWQGYVTHRHDRLSVRPHLTAPVSTNVKDGIARLEVVNNGLGPATILAFEVLLDGKAVEPRTWNKAETMVRALFSSTKWDGTFGELGPGYLMPAGQRFTILECRFGPMSPEEMRKIETTFNRSNLVVEYESLYGERFRYSTESKS
jgi:hypothetical protein